MKRNNMRHYVDFITYQIEAHTTAIYPVERAAEYLMLGLAGEVGEVTSLLAKEIRDDKPLDQTKLSKELGDVLWFLAEICTAYGMDFEQVAADNLAKLQSRRERGVISGSGDNR
jgi:NTP pyrophosphatase (non-canonical NTP hydrolase)